MDNEFNEFLLAQIDSFKTADDIKDRYLAAAACMYAAAERIHALHNVVNEMSKTIDALEKQIANYELICSRHVDGYEF